MDLFVFYLSHIKSFLSNELDIYVNTQKNLRTKLYNITEFITQCNPADLPISIFLECTLLPHPYFSIGLAAWILVVSLLKVPYEIVSVGRPVQVICRAESSNVTVLPVSSSSTPRMSPSTTHQVTSSVNGINVTAASVSSALSISGSASVAGGGAKKRRRRSVGLFSHNRTVLQYWFNNSAGTHTLTQLTTSIPYSFLAVRDYNPLDVRKNITFPSRLSSALLHVME